MQPSASLLFILGLSFCLSVNARPHVKRDEISLQNGMDAIALNARFRTLNQYSPCEGSEEACVGSSHAQCDQGYFARTPCGSGMVCRALPYMGSRGTTIGCITENEYTMRILATGVEYTPPPPEDSSQTSLSLDPAVISSGFKNDGRDVMTPGQVPSRTSSNNWINFCKTAYKPLTNGQQIPGGSCNSVPIGVIPSSDNMPSAKFISPQNFATFPQNQNITVQLAISHLETGWFTNPQKTYMTSPQDINTSGDVIGHSHITVDALTGFNQTTPTNPKTFAFFQAMNEPAVNGVLSTVIGGGLPAGYYRIAAIQLAANHQSIALPIARRGATSDMVYFSVV